MWVLVLGSAASFMVVLDLLVVATSLTAIQRDLGATLADLEWTITAYTISFAVLLMTAATLGERWGRRRVFAAGLVLFATASAACALAPSVAALVVARAVQGAGAAAIMPVALALLNAVFPPERRGWAVGVYGSVTGLAALLGPVVGGAVTQGLSWQWIFWLNVPIGLAAAPLVLRYAPVMPARPDAALDLPGLLLAGLGALGFIWGLVRANESGWAGTEVIGALLVGALATAAFVAWERRTPAPMLPLRLFGTRAFTAGNTVIFFLNAALTGAVFFTAQYFQVGLGQGALAAGLRLLPWGIAPLLIAPRAGALTDRFGERGLIVAGMVLDAAGLAWLAMIAGPHTGYLAMVAPMTVTGVGFSLAIPAVTKAVIGIVAPPDISTASGTYSTMRQLGGAFGVAVLGAVFAATGGYASPESFSAGYAAAIAAAAGMAFAGAFAGTFIRARRPALVPAIG
jgi:EmrB/QacA subfamily drug resistance transporter